MFWKTLTELKRLGESWRTQRVNILDKEEGATVNKTPNIIEMSPRKPSQATNLDKINKELASFGLYANLIKDSNKFASLLTDWMSLSKHHTPIGLWATRQLRTYSIAVLFNISVSTTTTYSLTIISVVFLHSVEFILFNLYPCKLTGNG